jgi:hypothetical protein
METRFDLSTKLICQTEEGLILYSLRRYNEEKLVSSTFMTYQIFEELEANHFLLTAF